MLLDATADPSTRVVLILRPEGDVGVAKLVIRVERLNVLSPRWLSRKVSALPHMLEEEALVSKQARNDWRGDANVSDVLNDRVAPESSTVRGDILRHHSEDGGALWDLLQLLVERHLFSAHKLAILRPHIPNVFDGLKPEVKREGHSGVDLLPIGLPARKFRQAHCSDLSGSFNELGSNSVLEAVVTEVGDDRAEVVGEEVEAVARVEARVCQQVDRRASIDQELDS